MLSKSSGARDNATIDLLIKSVLESNSKDRLQALDEFLLSLQRVGTDLHQLAAADPQNTLTPLVSQVDDMLAASKQFAMDSSRPQAERIAAAKVLCRPEKYRETAVELLSEWLRPQIDPNVQSQAIDAIAQSGINQVPAVLAKAWPELSPQLRSHALDAWLARENWTSDLLDRLEKQLIPVGSLDLTQRARLLQHPVKALATRAKAILEVANQSTRKQIVAQYRPSLELVGQSTNGKLVYARACANCHRRGDEGHDVGPNLATVVEHPNEKLLTNILDPNADIQPGYQAYTCLLDSGEILAGLLTSETANSLTIKQANGVLRTIARWEIERLQNSNQSFMPEGLEMSISPQDMADLLSYLHQPIQIK